MNAARRKNVHCLPSQQLVMKYGYCAETASSFHHLPPDSDHRITEYPELEGAHKNH